MSNKVHFIHLTKDKLYSGVLCKMYSNKSTHDIKKVTCKMCLKKHKNSN